MMIRWLERTSENHLVASDLDPGTVSKSSLCIRHSQAFGALMYIEVICALHDLEAKRSTLYTCTISKS